jgi:peptidyl-dipeptidase A
MRTTPAILLVALSMACTGPKTDPDPVTTQQEEALSNDPATFVRQVDEKLLALYRAAETAHWQHETDITDEHEAAAAAADEQTMAFLTKAITHAATLPEATDPAVARQIHLLKVAGTLPAPSDPAKRTELASIAANLSSTYGKGKWCRAEGECMDIGEISELLATSKDPAAMQAAWEGWHTISVPMREEYTRFVALANEGAKEIGFSNTGELWRSGYDMPPAQIEAEVDRLWGQLGPLYDALQCHVRAELSEHYGPEVVPPTGPLPAHMLGNLWAQDWSAVYPIVEPNPGQPSLDVNKSLKEQSWDAQKMTKTAEAFFVSLGLDPLPATFWERSMFVQPEGREVVCHASAWDPSWSDDLRIKMCIEPTKEDLVTLHHELGHLYYYHYYLDQPTLFRNGANDGFHEAIGDTIALSITPSYLKQMGLLSEASEAPEAVVNAQMQVALERLAFLPFGLVVDKWRWEVFDGRITPAEYNAGWWRLRQQYQGVAPVATRGEEFFDAGAKYHVPANTPYLRYFLAHVLEFQLHRSLCQTAGHQGPLHSCSIYGSKEAGEKLRSLLEVGASKPWPDALEAATGQRELDASAMVEYFQPLMSYLQEKNKTRTCGW